MPTSQNTSPAIAYPDEPTVLVERPSPAVAEVVLNRPRQRNALSLEMIAMLRDRLQEITADSSVEVILLRGAGGCFCSGLDLSSIDPQQAPDELIYPALLSVHAQLARTDQAIVVALEKAAINGGAALALAGDLVIAGETSFLRIFELSMGLRIPMNLAWLASRYGSSTAMQLILEGKPWFGEDLRRLAVASQSVPDGDVLATARQVAAHLGAYPAGAIRANIALMKQLRGPMSEESIFERLPSSTGAER
ncbi:enoyl-CoA hydratase/isomerase family protein [Nocardioides alcanivorans]|uniref:enoyl-CoA hydratase/isomerase family protein n=1 Tax=Nocardioides alcanivorans TaxID=2897352 RepID=UPI001F309ACA|nr:enoyl-CoA hydratase/isomerase family protein [Nocardioides alcanivorans]